MRTRLKIIVDHEGKTWYKPEIKPGFFSRWSGIRMHKAGLWDTNIEAGGSLSLLISASFLEKEKAIRLAEVVKGQLLKAKEDAKTSKDTYEYL